MGLFRQLFSGQPDPLFVAAAQAAPTFSIGPDEIPAEVFGLESYADPVAISPRIDRKSASQVPAVKRCRDLIAGSLGGLPLTMSAPDRTTVACPLFEQPEADTARSVSMARTFEDLLFEGVAWWRVVGRDWRGYPVKVRRLDPRSVNVHQDGKVYYSKGRKHSGMAQEWIPDAELIRFDSPNDPLLVAGARAIRTILRLEAAASSYAEGGPPVDYFTGRDGVDVDDPQAFIDDWSVARRRNLTGYVPAGVEYHREGWTPEQLQMADARQHAVLEIARLAGVDPEEIGVSTTSRTYSNQADRRKAFIDFTLGGYMHAVEDRLSMADVTPRGYRARFDLDEFLRSADAKTRYESYEVGLRIGAISAEEINEAEDRPMSSLPADPVTEGTPVSASITAEFAEDEGLRFDAPGAVAFKVDSEKRTISGLAVPYGLAATSRGQAYQFSQGSLTWAEVSRVKLWVNHQPDQAVGVATALEDREDGLFATFRVARGAEGDRALSMAEDGVWDGLSIQVKPDGKYEARDGINHAVSVPLMEVSLTPAPAFDSARVSQVAASAAERNVMTDTANEAQGQEPQAHEPVDFSGITDAIKAGFDALQGSGPEVVKAGAPLEVQEPLPYRFDGVPGAHDFSTDLIAYGRDRDAEAGQRVMEFMADAFGPRFDVDTADVNEANPSRQRPDMYVDERVHKNPFYSALYKGSIPDQTPFVFPRFNSASGLVSDHVEGTEPTPGDFTMTGQTVTPSAVSGKVEITREVWDQGGNPQVSGLIWRKMVQHYFDAMETKAVAVLTAAAASITDIGLTAGAADDDLVNELEAAIAALQFVAGGNTFDFAGTQIDLYKKLAAAVDSTGRKLLPIINPTNANGRANSGFNSLDVAGTTFTPARSLAATGSVVANSWLVDTSSVHIWNTAPMRLEFQTRVAYVDLGIWGYCATAISDLNGVRQITYDPVA